MTEPRPLRVFLCHASQDKPAVRELYKRLAAEKWIDPWLDEEKLLPGQDFDLEIYKAARDSDSIIICLSKVSVAKEGYVNKEIRHALDAADEKPEGAIYIIPLRLDDCSPSFERLKKLHWADYFTPNAHEKLIKVLHLRADALKIETSENKVELVAQPKPTAHAQDFDVDLDLYRFIQIPATDESLWKGFLKFNEDCIQIGKWGNEGWSWFQEKMQGSKRIIPDSWDDENFGIVNPENPVVGITWFESNAYCTWLLRHWNEVMESKANTSLRPRLIRLPLDTEWTIAAGGETPEYRFPWDAAGKATTDIKEIVKRANIKESSIRHTTPVNAYLRGSSPHGVMDIVGNVWEWQVNYSRKNHEYLIIRGGSWSYSEYFAPVSFRESTRPSDRNNDLGFRMVMASLPVSLWF
jgi:hypothetical protein